MVNVEVAEVAAVARRLLVGEASCHMLPCSVRREKTPLAGRSQLLCKTIKLLYKYIFIYYISEPEIIQAKTFL